MGGDLHKSIDAPWLAMLGCVESLCRVLKRVWTGLEEDGEIIIGALTTNGELCSTAN